MYLVSYASFLVILHVLPKLYIAAFGWPVVKSAKIFNSGGTSLVFLPSSYVDTLHTARFVPPSSPNSRDTERTFDAQRHQFTTAPFFVWEKPVIEWHLNAVKQKKWGQMQLIINRPKKKGHSWLFWLYIKWFVVRKLFVNSSTLKVFTVSPFRFLF
jgi:hypothetical protein